VNKKNIISDPNIGNGMLTDPVGESLDMLKLMQYCKKNNIAYDKLTDAEVNQFRHLKRSIKAYDGLRS